jgi:cephalosporin hydroxylase
MDDTAKFFQEVDEEIALMKNNKELRENGHKYLIDILKWGYTYHFTWMGFPIIQIPQDIIAMQELIFKVKPDLIIETGIARGGSMIFYASMMELLGNGGKVLGIDIDIRAHNKARIESHSLYKNIDMFEGSSIEPKMVQKVKEYSRNFSTTLVALDSCHTYEHVFAELNAYSPLVTKGSYLVAFDTISKYIEKPYTNQSYKPTIDPQSAVFEFLKCNDRFAIDQDIESKLLLTVCPSGYLKCVK